MAVRFAHRRRGAPLNTQAGAAPLVRAQPTRKVQAESGSELLVPTANGQLQRAVLVIGDAWHGEAVGGVGVVTLLVTYRLIVSMSQQSSQRPKQHCRFALIVHMLLRLASLCHCLCLFV